MEQALVSVLMTAYNREKYIAEAVENMLPKLLPKLSDLTEEIKCFT
jgi:glycosyltransferase involved in cell wall biosynthesis